MHAEYDFSESLKNPYTEVCRKKTNDDYPPNTIERVQQFMDLSEEYLLLVPELDGPLFLGTTADKDGREMIRVAVLSLALRRKFLFGDDAVRLTVVIDDLEDNVRSVNKPISKKLKTFLQNLSQLKKKMETTEYLLLGSEIERKTGSFSEDFLYGRILHSDYSKWKNTTPINWQPMLKAFNDQEKQFRELLRLVRECIMDLESQGIIQGVRYTREFETDSYSYKGIQKQQ